MRHLACTLLALSLPLLAGGCATSAADTAPAPEASATKAASNKALDKEADLAEAKLALELAVLSADQSAEAAQATLDQASTALSEAVAAVERFGEHSRPHRLRGARLSVDRAARRVRESEQELEQMELMYAEEGELDASTEKTKELVLERSRKTLEFARRSVELERATLEDLEARELPRQARELEAKRAKAEQALTTAQAKQAKGEIEGRISLMKARRKIEKIERGDAAKGAAKGAGK